MAPRPRTSPPLEARVFVNLMVTRLELWSRFVPLAREHGLTYQQYNVLRILRGGGQQGLPSQVIGERMIERVPDVTRLVDRLEAAGLVERTRSLEDRRVVHVRLAAKGGELLARLDEPVNELHRRQLGHMSKGELRELDRLLTKARAGA